MFLSSLKKNNNKKKEQKKGRKEEETDRQAGGHALRLALRSAGLGFCSPCATTPTLTTQLPAFALSAVAKSHWFTQQSDVN